MFIYNRNFISKHTIICTSKTVPDFVKDAYLRVLGRPTDAGGLAHFVNLIESGQINRKDLDAILRSSEEYKLVQLPPKTLPEVTICNPKATIGIIALNEEEYIRACLKSIYNWDCCHEIIIVEGSTDLWREANPDSVMPNGSSKDKTVEIIKNFPDLQHKIKLIQGKWKDKMEARNAYLTRATGDFLFQIDCDEFYTHNDLGKLKSVLINKGCGIEQLTIPHIIFWRGFDKKLTGGRFTRVAMERFWKLKIDGKRIKHKTHTEMVKADGSGLKRTESGIHCYHYGNVIPRENYKNKVDFMKLRNEKAYRGVLKKDLEFHDAFFMSGEKEAKKLAESGIEVVQHDYTDNPRQIKLTPQYRKFVSRTNGKHLKVLMLFQATNNTIVSGGQYAAWRYAEALTMVGVDATVVTDAIPGYANPEIRTNIIRGDLNWNAYNKLNYPEYVFNQIKDYTGYDAIIGFASSYIMPAVLYGQHHEVPVISVGFENGYSLLKYGGRTYIGTAALPDYINYKKGIPLSDHVVCVSKFSRDTMKMWVGEEACPPTSVVYPPINEIAADKVLAETPDYCANKKPYIMTIGSGSDKKTAEWVPAAAKKMRNKVGVRAIIQSPPGIIYANRVNQAAQGLEDFKSFLKIPEKQKFELIANAAVMVNPFLTAGGDYQSKEALYCCTPALTLNIPCMIECHGRHAFITDENIAQYYVRDHINGPLEDQIISLIAQKLDYIIDNPDIAMKKAKEGKKFIAANHTMKAVGKQLKGILEGVLR